MCRKRGDWKVRNLIDCGVGGFLEKGTSKILWVIKLDFSIATSLADLFHLVVVTANCAEC